MGTTKIEWAHETVNIVAGCTKASPGCDGCYAERMANRIAHNHTVSKDKRQAYSSAIKMDTSGEKSLGWSDKVTLIPGGMFDLARIAASKKPKMIFVQSMGDLFHDTVMEMKIPNDEMAFNSHIVYSDSGVLDHAFNIMRAAKHHTFLLLTKRPKNMAKYFGLVAQGEKRSADNFATLPTPEMRTSAAAKMAADNAANPIPSNIWLGVTVENQAMADERIPWLLRIPAATRFVSIEPMLGPVDLRDRQEKYAAGYCGGHDWLSGEQWKHSSIFGGGKSHYNINLYPEDWEYQEPRLHWIICGGETGPGARPMHPNWARSLRDQCQAAGVPFFFKSWGDWLLIDHPDTKPEKAFRVGKRRAGRLLDGREWLEFPEGAPANA